MDEINLDEAVGEIAEGLGFGTDLDAGDSNVGVDDSSGDPELEVDDSGASKSSETEETVEAESGEADSEESGDSKVEEIRAPDTWRPDAAKEFAALPPVVREEILKRESDISKGIEGYRQDANIGKVFKEVIAPYIPLCREAGVDPMQQVSRLMFAHQVLLTKPLEEKKEIFKKLAQQYGIDNLEITSTSPEASDPIVSGLKKEVDELKSHLYTQSEREANRVRQTLQQEIDTFASDPAHPHFDTVIEDMTILIQSGKAANLQEAYDQAIWLNPHVREAELARKASEQLTQLKQEESKKVKLIKKATGVNVTSSANRASGAAPLGTMDDTLLETLKSINSRA